MVPSATLFSIFAMLAAASAQASSSWKPAKNQLCFGRQSCHYASDEANKRQGNLMSHIFPDEVCIRGKINPESWVDRIPKCG
ncbi:uncharacterized protein G6M90_00g070430 [Metarhizium brunneum]|uniref:Uncharacterized protein n=1 Tax=Metarhizium brunneum TaxID=500148 RepID=A0A7D5Z6W6_9HYPO